MCTTDAIRGSMVGCFLDCLRTFIKRMFESKMLSIKSASEGFNSWKITAIKSASEGFKSRSRMAVESGHSFDFLIFFSM